MGLRDTVVKSLRSLFDADRIERANADSPSGQALRAAPANSIYSVWGREDVGGLLAVSQNLVDRYADYEAMLDYPDIRTAVHYFASDATQPNIDNGKVIWTTSNDRAIVGLANDLLGRRLRLEDDIFSLAFELCAYGNSFLELLVTENGLIGTNALPPATVRRVDQTDGTLIGFIQDISGRFTADQMDLRRMLAGEVEIPPTTALFEDWQINHFRLRSHNRRSSYGSSVSESARWIWKRLVMLEDAVMIYKLCLAGDSKVWTPTGYQLIKNLSVGDDVWSFNQSGELVQSKVTYSKCNGVDQLYEVRSANRKLVANGTHPVLVEYKDGELRTQRYVPVTELQPGVHSFVTPSFPEEHFEDVALAHTHVTPANCPQFVDETFARLFGYVSNAARVMCTNPLVMLDVDNHRVNDYAPAFKRYLHTSVLRSFAVTDGLFDFWRVNGLDLEIRRLPEWIFVAAPHVKYAFIQGVADAHIRDDTSATILSTAEYVAQLQVLVQQLGLTAGLPYAAADGLHALHISFADHQSSELIESVTKTEVGGIYDIGVDSYLHNFVADGVVVHNTRSPARNVFYVDVTDIPPAKREAYLKKQARDVKKKSLVDPKTGRLDMRYNPLCVAGDTKIPLLDGTNPTILEIIDKHNAGEEQWVYSVDRDDECKLVPGKIIWAGKTRANAELGKITLDDGSTLRVTPDHKMIRRDGSYVEAKDLKPHDSLMPFRRKHEKRQGYEMVYCPKSGQYHYTHRLLGQQLLGKVAHDGNVVHHKDHVKTNNTPSNLELMNKFEHTSYHFTVYNQTEEKRAATSIKNRERDSGKYIRAYNKSEKHKLDNEIRRDGQLQTHPEAFIQIVKDVIRANPTAGVHRLVDVLRERNDVLPILVEANTHLNRNTKSVNTGTIAKLARDLGFNTYPEFRQSVLCDNHKVAKIEFESAREDTYCITVDVYGNFATESGLFVKNSLDEDLFIGISEGKQHARVEVLAGPDYQCLAGETTIELLDGTTPTIKELAERGGEFWVFGCTPEGKVAPARGHSARVSGRDAPIWEVALDNETTVRCTWNHPFLTQDGRWVRARDLVIGTALMPLDGMSPRISVSRVTETDSRETVYDLTVDDVHCFAIGQGVFVHNSMNDILYFQNKMHGALMVPRAFLGQEAPAAGRGLLSAEDARAARVTMTVQREIRNGVERMIRIDQAARGFPNPWQTEFTVNMTVPSGVYELAAMEVRNARADLANRMLPFVSMRWVREHVFKMSMEEIDAIEQQADAEAMLQADRQRKQMEIAQPPQPPPPNVPPDGMQLPGGGPQPPQLPGGGDQPPPQLPGGDGTQLPTDGAPPAEALPPDATVADTTQLPPSPTGKQPVPPPPPVDPSAYYAPTPGSSMAMVVPPGGTAFPMRGAPSPFGRPAIVTSGPNQIEWQRIRDQQARLEEQRDKQSRANHQQLVDKLEQLKSEDRRFADRLSQAVQLLQEVKAHAFVGGRANPFARPR